MAVAFTRTNQFILGQGVMLITGNLTITSSATNLTPSDLGVNKFISVNGACINGDGKTVLPTVNSAGDTMSCFAGNVTGGSPLPNSTFPVNTYVRLSFLAV